MRNLGRLGESVFQAWCAQDGISYNSSVIDETGWDFYLEMPNAFGDRAPAVHDAALECKVQVKATDKKTRKWSVKLSNLKKLATAPMPAFFVFLEFDGKSLPVRAYLLHVDAQLITQILTRVYREEEFNQAFNHHKKTMTIKYGKSNEIAITEGPFLKNAIGHRVGDMHKYVENKQAHLKSTGFEGGAVTLNFSADGAQGIQDLIDVSIGARDSVDVINFRGFNTRFGLQNSTPSFDHAKVKLEMPDLQPTAVGYLRVLNEEQKFLKLACKFYISPFSNPNASNTLRFRVTGDNFELVTSPHKGKATMTFNVTKGRLPIRRLRDCLRFMRLMYSSSRAVNVDFLPDGRPTFKFTLHAGGLPFEHTDSLLAIERATQILSHVDCHEDVPVSLAEIYRQTPHINVMWLLLVQAEPAVMNFSIESPEFDPTRPTACIFKFVCRMGQYSICALVAALGSQTFEKEGKTHLLTDKTVIERFYFFNADDPIEHDILEAHTRLADEKYSIEYQVLGIGGMYGG